MAYSFKCYYRDHIDAAAFDGTYAYILQQWHYDCLLFTIIGTDRKNVGKSESEEMTNSRD